MASDWASLLGSKKKLDREKSLNKLREVLHAPSLQTDEKTSIEGHITQLLTQSLASPWEEKHGGLMAAGVMVQEGYASEQFCERMKGEVPLFLEDAEYRVRLAAGEFV